MPRIGDILASHACAEDGPLKASRPFRDRSSISVGGNAAVSLSTKELMLDKFKLEKIFKSRYEDDPNHSRILVDMTLWRLRGRFVSIMANSKWHNNFHGTLYMSI